jgi:hypothetical protein
MEMKTIRQAIEELSDIENQDQPVVIVWYLADDFEYADGTPSPSPEQFGEALKDAYLSSDELAEEINDILYDFMLNEEDEDEDDEEDN